MPPLRCGRGTDIPRWVSRGHEHIALLVQAGVTAFEEVEILASLREHEASGSTLEQLAARTGTSSERASACVASLAALGLAEEYETGRWRVTGTKAGLTDALDGLQKPLRKDRARVANLFYSQRLDSLRAFSQAFRFRRDR